MECVRECTPRLLYGVTIAAAHVEYEAKLGHCAYVDRSGYAAALSIATGAALYIVFCARRAYAPNQRVCFVS